MASNKFFDDITRLVGDAAGAASGVRREIETMVKAQIERFLRDMDVATREEVGVLRDQVADLRRENERLAGRVSQLEGSPAGSDGGAGGPAKRARAVGRSGPAANDAATPGTDAPSGNTL